MAQERQKEENMKSSRQEKILEIIKKHEVGTQEDLSAYLEQAGYQVTQATVSRDIRELKLIKVALDNGRQKYAVGNEGEGQHIVRKYIRVFQDGVRSIDMAQNILVVKTESGMAMAVAAALDAMDCKEVVGSIAGDDTVMCAVRTVEDTALLMERLRKLAGATAE